MVRIGQNPNRGTSPEMRISNIVLTCVTHLPNLNGYHAKRLEVVQKCLTSMRDHAGSKYTVIVWDNGSCEAFRKWVMEEYQPDIFIRSVNVGKSVARASLFGMLDPDTIVNYSDDDIYYYPNWLSPQIKLLKHFPDVSCVTGYPIRSSFQLGNKNTITRLKPKYGRFIPQEWEDDHAASIGLDKRLNEALNSAVNDIVVEYKGVKAFATSHHCQQIGRAGLLVAAARRVLMYNSMPTETPYDKILDEMGNRLATLKRYTRHMGNVIDDNLRRDIVDAEKTNMQIK